MQLSNKVLCSDRQKSSLDAFLYEHSDKIRRERLLADGRTDGQIRQVWRFGLNGLDAKPQSSTTTIAPRDPGQAL